MKKTQRKQLLSFILCLVLIAAMALLTTACDNFNLDFLGTEQEAATNAPNTNGADNSGEAPIAKKQFTFVVVDGNGIETTFQISTDKNIVGDALLAEGLIAGEEGAYGLYVKTVNGITADYDVDKTYWAFYINGEYAMTGADSTDIAEGSVYRFEYTK